jgi:hypothetical protein
MVFFARATGDPDPPHYSPVRPDRAHLVEGWALHSFGVMHRTYRVTTRDGFSALVTVSGIEIVDPATGPGCALYVWPRFQVKGWNKYYLGFFPPSISSSLGTGKIHEVWGRRDAGANNPHMCMPVAQEYCQTDFVPETVVVVWEQDKELYYARYDTQADERFRLDNAAYRSFLNLNLGFDFGTTNTAAAAFAIPETGAREGNLDMPLAISDCTLRLLDGTPPADHTWLPQPLEGGTLPFIPSQLYFFEPHYLPRLSPNDQPVRHFTIPFFQDDPPGEERCVGGFKWASNLRSMSEKAPDLRYLFCKLALEMYLAEMVSTYGIRPGPLTLITTYPLAFGALDREIHSAVFERLRPELQSATGFQITLGKPLDESHAAEECGESIPNAAVILHMDVGGGTSDLCISQEADGGRGRTVSVVDSIEFGGEHVNAAIERLTHLSPAQLRRRIRTDGSKVYRDPSCFEGNQQRVDAVEHTIDRFGAGLVEIAARFAAAECVNNEVARPRIGLIMFGSGWKTIFDSGDRHDIEQQAAESVSARLRELQAIGLIPDVPEILCKYPADPKGVVAKGAARVGGRRVIVDQRGAQTYLLEDVRVITGRAERSSPWTQRTPVPFNALPGKIVLCNTARFRFEAARVAVNGAIEALDDIDFSECLHGTDLARSPFAVYVARFYRAELAVQQVHHA